jgi:hypothetical protein
MGRLRFYARGTAQVTDVHAQERGVRRCVGRRWQEVTTGRWAWVPTEEPQEIDYHADLVRACRDGDLWAADAATAKECRVPFDPTFGGEVTETIKAFKAKKADEAKQVGDGGKPSAGGKGDV